MVRELIEPEITYFNPIKNKKGNIFHALKYTDKTFNGFEEAYFSEVNFRDIKGWKQHTEMILNLVVPVGKILFVILDPNKKFYGEYVLGENNYGRLTIPPGYWLAFIGLTNKRNLLLNVSNLLHDPNEQYNCSVEMVDFDLFPIIRKHLEQ